MTFASMFPHNVGRIAVDGIVSMTEYYTTEWSNNLVYATLLLLRTLPLTLLSFQRSP
jgi:hypothetical protein